MDASRLHNGINQTLQQQLNLSLILRLLWKEGLCSRATLSKLSGLQRPTISNIIQDCIQCGLVVEQGLIDGEKHCINPRIPGILKKEWSVRFP